MSCAARSRASSFRYQDTTCESELSLSAMVREPERLYMLTARYKTNTVDPSNSAKSTFQNRVRSMIQVLSLGDACVHTALRAAFICVVTLILVFCATRVLLRHYYGVLCQIDV